MLALVSLVNTLRVLGAHAYELDGAPRDRRGQLADSLDTPGGPWTELWAPVGLRYHALHHYFPGIPYHNLGVAYRRIVETVPGMHGLPAIDEPEPAAIARVALRRRRSAAAQQPSAVELAESMAHFGIITPPVSGHIHPFRHSADRSSPTAIPSPVFRCSTSSRRSDSEGLGSSAIGESDHPRGSLPQSLAELGRRKGRAALTFTIQAVAQTSVDGVPRCARRHSRRGGRCASGRSDGARRWGRRRIPRAPFVTVCNALAINRDPISPPPFTPWQFRDAWWATLRNRVGYFLSDRMTRPITEWSLITARDGSCRRSAHPMIRSRSSRRSARCLGSSTSPAPRSLSASTTWDQSAPAYPDPIPFPWERLDGRPLVYASLGTLQNNREPLFRCFAAACEGLDVQLVISHGGGLSDSQAKGLPGDPLVVSYAPQYELLARAALTITHAGLNTVLDSVANGVPVVTVPITYEQPAIARRVEWTGAGRTLSLNGLTPQRMKTVVSDVLTDTRYRRKAGELADAIRQAGGVVVPQPSRSLYLARVASLRPEISIASERLRMSLAKVVCQLRRRTTKEGDQSGDGEAARARRGERQHRDPSSLRDTQDSHQHASHCDAEGRHPVEDKSKYGGHPRTEVIRHGDRNPRADRDLGPGHAKTHGEHQQHGQDNARVRAEGARWRRRENQSDNHAGNQSRNPLECADTHRADDNAQPEGRFKSTQKPGGHSFGSFAYSWQEHLHGAQHEIEERDGDTQRKEHRHAIDDSKSSTKLTDECRQGVPGLMASAADRRRSPPSRLGSPPSQRRRSRRRLRRPRMPRPRLPSLREARPALRQRPAQWPAATGSRGLRPEAVSAGTSCGTMLMRLELKSADPAAKSA